ncbi:MAG: hypothetical protein PF572_01710 [Patescibacteria group bacterium]|jgi:hypothetical protein|nr:hypothetical protein [Patescibacteria group bacterium]
MSVTQITINNEAIAPENTIKNFKDILYVEEVSVKVPKISQHMNKIPAHPILVDGKVGEVQENWMNGFVIQGSKVILYRHYYNISKSNIGKNITATVKVIKKEMLDGQLFTLVNVIHTPGVIGTKTMKFVRGNVEFGVEIIGTDTKICFQDIQKN